MFKKEENKMSRISTEETEIDLDLLESIGKEAALTWACTVIKVIKRRYLGCIRHSKMSNLAATSLGKSGRVDYSGL